MNERDGENRENRDDRENREGGDDRTNRTNGTNGINGDEWEISYRAKRYPSSFSVPITPIKL